MDEGVDVKKIDTCIGDTEADMDNLVLLSEQEAQVGWFVTLKGYTYK